MGNIAKKHRNKFDVVSPSNRAVQSSCTSRTSPGWKMAY